MKLLKSKKFKLPTLYFITDREEIKKLPIGVPFIYGEEKDKEYFIRLLEYEVLYKKALATGLPFKFKRILEDAGFKDLIRFSYQHPAYMEITTEELIEDGSDWEIEDSKRVFGENTLFKEYVKDAAAYVDIQKLKDLNVFPIWVDKLEKAIETNLHNFAIYNPNMYNKKLDGMYGSIDFTSPRRNVIFVDISGSIPKAVSSIILVLVKHLADSFYADILITGSKSTLYHYENLHSLNIKTIYDENGMDNDQVYFKKLVTGDVKHYRTAIVFGDNHSPSMKWSNKFNKNTKEISREDGKKMCKWKIDKLISFHTGGTTNIAGYADWFEPKDTEKIDNWVKYLD